MTQLVTFFFYVQACDHPAIRYVEYSQNNVTAQEENVASKDENADACQNVSIEHGTPYSIEIRRPNSLSSKQARCERLKEQLQNRTQTASANNDDNFFTAVETCITTENVVELQARFNSISLSYVSPYIYILYIHYC